jgi:hypothetical protein
MFKVGLHSKCSALDLQSASGTVMKICGSVPSTREICPSPVVSSASMTSPALKIFFTPLLTSISQEPAIVTRYCRRGAGWRSRTVPGGTHRKTARGRRSRVGSENLLVAAEFELQLFKVGFLIAAGVESGDFHLVLLGIVRYKVLSGMLTAEFAACPSLAAISSQRPYRR